MTHPQPEIYLNKRNEVNSVQKAEQSERSPKSGAKRTPRSPKSGAKRTPRSPKNEAKRPTQITVAKRPTQNPPAESPNRQSQEPNQLVDWVNRKPLAGRSKEQPAFSGLLEIAHFIADFYF